MTEITLYDTRTRHALRFSPIHEGKVGMYHCGPTVYDFAHVGNLRAYVFADLLRRMFEASGYEVKQVMNITDVGHLVSDADDGEDKIEKGAKREGRTVEEIIAHYSSAFLSDLDALNVLRPHKMPRATEHIPEQVAMIKTLEMKGHTYRAGDGIYFDASTYPAYADFARLDLSGQRAGARVEASDGKRHPYDFALWKFSGAEKRLQEWDSPWGKGFPGWHIECSAMSQKYLGERFDLHTGGIDHIPVHHTNEIAQSECATGKSPFVNYWMHSGFMTVDGEKMSKSLGNTFRLSDLETRGVSPAALRLWFLMAKYSSQINFTWDALRGAERLARSFARELADVVPHEVPVTVLEAFRHDLDTPRILGLLSSLAPSERLATLNLLGVDLSTHIAAIKAPLPDAISKLVLARDEARRAKDWAASDRLRGEIESHGYAVEDGAEGTRVVPE